MKAESSKGSRGTFSNFGFLMASVGSAVGLGNLWKFPYLTGTNGGGIFVLIYLCILLTVGFACILGEMTIGRFTKLNPIGAYRKIAEKYTFAGVIGVVVAFLIVTYYNIIGGWILKYFFSYILGQSKVLSTNSEAFFGEFITSPFEPIIWTLVFIVINLFILKAGVIKGIERAAKFMMPLLFILLIVTAIRSVTLPGAMEGVKFFLKPDISELSMSTVSAALGQVFFSLSLGMGITITYGSYLSETANLEKNAVMVPLFDTVAAILSGFAILPAVFAFGFDPSEGPGLIFVTLPSVFGSMPGGFIFGALFFLLVLFAAITSSLSLLEVPTSYLIDNRNWDRKKAVYILSIIIFLISIPESLSNGVWQTKFFGMAFFDFVGYIAEAVLMPLCGLLMCIVIGYVWGTDNAAIEIKNNGKMQFKSETYWKILIKYIAPILIFGIWLNSTGLLSLIGIK